MDITWISRAKENTRLNLIGRITKFDKIDDYKACPVCLKKVSEDNLCNKCKGTVRPISRLIVSVILEDDSGAIKATLFGVLAEKLIHIKKRERERYLSLTPVERYDTQEFVQKLMKRLGRKVLASGKVVRSEFTNLLEVTVNELLIFKQGGVLYDDT